ncbi:MAG: hypothetical protein V7746_16825 [Halioglobus sp.]
MHKHRSQYSVGAIMAALLAAISQFALGDSLHSRCGYSSDSNTDPEAYHSCVFSQRQGYITVSIGDQVSHQFTPDGDVGGTYLDQQEQRVYRKKGLGNSGQLFQLHHGFLHVLWDPIPSRFECNRSELTSPNQCELGDGNAGFRLQASSGSSLNSLKITPIGLEIDNTALVLELDGTAYLAELADLDSNGWPELYVYSSSAGSGSYGSLTAFAVNGGKSATPVYLPPINTDPAASEGYQGHDEFRVVENRLVRRYPVYRDTDTNAAPSGGTRQLQYRLVAGEAGWRLEVDQIVNY